MTPSNSNNNKSSWISHKEQGTLFFQQSNHAQSLISYRSALALHPPLIEQQVLLSNIVACHLKLGHTDEAIQDAKACVALNESWPKGQVRLASAYSMAGKSNDACNALQRALQLDPTYTVARDMLRAELRRGPAPTAPPEEFDTATDDTDNEPTATNVEDSVSWLDRVEFAWRRMIQRYHEQPQDRKSVLQVLLGILVLYVAFGGRFGFEHFSPGQQTPRGNYGSGNAYDRYRHPQPRTQRPTVTQEYTSTRSSFGFPNLLDGSPFSMLIVAAIVFVCHQNGINPFHAIVMLNVVTGNRGQGMNRMGMYRMGYGMARNQRFWGGNPFARPRNGWH